jgi:hypothetical protein
MEKETERFFTGAVVGFITGVIGWAALVWMIAAIVGRV